MHFLRKNVKSNEIFGTKFIVTVTVTITFLSKVTSLLKKVTSYCNVVTCNPTRIDHTFFGFLSIICSLICSRCKKIWPPSVGEAMCSR